MVLETTKGAISQRDSVAEIKQEFVERVRANIEFNTGLINELSETLLGRIINRRRISTLKIINSNLELLILNTK